VLAASAVPAARADDGLPPTFFDARFVHIRAHGPEDATVGYSFVIYGLVRSTGPNATVQATITSIGGGGHHEVTSEAHVLNFGPVGLDATAGGAEVHRPLLESGSGGLQQIIVPVFGKLLPGQALDAVVFLANGTFELGELWGPQSPGLSASVTFGMATHDLTVAQPGDAGTAVSVGLAATGGAMHHQRLDGGIVGVALPPDVGGGPPTWTAPDMTASSDDPVFAGPGGDWSFNYSGTRVGGNQYAAYVDLGDDWSAFRPTS